MARSLDSRLAELEQYKARVGEVDPARLTKLLAQMARQKFPDARSLARFHDMLMFLRAFPPDRSVQRQADSLLFKFSRRVKQLAKARIDLSSIQDEEEFAGIAGTTLTAMLDYEETRWLVQRFPGQVSIDWEGYENDARLGAALPRFVPLLEEDSFVEPDVPYRDWLRAASGGRELEWLIAQFERCPLSPALRSEIFGSLELPIRWELGDSRATRTHARRKVQSLFFHREPLIHRKDVSLAQELAKAPLKLERLSRREGEEIITMCREATSVRYRELYGTTRGDPSDVVRADVGRGVEIFLWGLPADKRLPLRAYQAGFTLKNGVPINYIEGIALFEWMEIGFNTFYAYRDGETAWIYAQVLRSLHQRLGAKCISVYPYQIGRDNEEALASGAFWFYRKLGFRPMRLELERLAEREETKIAADRHYRTPLRTLRRLAEGHVVYELPGTERRAWDRFRMRHVGMAVQGMMARRFGGDGHRMIEALRLTVARSLGIRPEKWSKEERRAFDSFCLVLALVPDLVRWQSVEKSRLVDLIRAKATSTDGQYAKLLLEHSRLRGLFLRIGSEAPAGIRANSR
jgi:hypothetical protein